MSPKPDVSAERTEQILDAAVTVFSEQGFDKARMSDIGEEAGISKATVYLYFKSKEALISALVERLFKREMGALEVLTGEETSACQRLQNFFAALLDDLTRMRPLMPLIYEFYALGFRKAAVRCVLGAFFTRFIELVTPVIEEGIAQGEFVSSDARQSAIALGSIMEGTLLLWAFAPEQVDLEKQLPHGFMLLLTGMSSEN